MRHALDLETEARQEAEEAEAARQFCRESAARHGLGFVPQIGAFDNDDSVHGGQVDPRSAPPLNESRLAARRWRRHQSPERKAAPDSPDDKRKKSTKMVARTKKKQKQKQQAQQNQQAQQQQAQQNQQAQRPNQMSPGGSGGKDVAKSKRGTPLHARGAWMRADRAAPARPKSTRALFEALVGAKANAVMQHHHEQQQVHQQPGSRVDHVEHEGPRADDQDQDASHVRRRDQPQQQRHAHANANTHTANPHHVNASPPPLRQLAPIDRALLPLSKTAAAAGCPSPYGPPMIVAQAQPALGGLVTQMTPRLSGGGGGGGGGLAGPLSHSMASMTSELSWSTASSSLLMPRMQSLFAEPHDGGAPRVELEFGHGGDEDDAVLLDGATRPNGGPNASTLRPVRVNIALRVRGPAGTVDVDIVVVTQHSNGALSRALLSHSPIIESSSKPPAGGALRPSPLPDLTTTTPDVSTTAIPADHPAVQPRSMLKNLKKSTPLAPVSRATSAPPARNVIDPRSILGSGLGAPAAGILGDGSTPPRRNSPKTMLVPLGSPGKSPGLVAPPGSLSPGKSPGLVAPPGSPPITSIASATGSPTVPALRLRGVQEAWGDGAGASQLPAPNKIGKDARTKKKKKLQTLANHQETDDRQHHNQSSGFPVYHAAIPAAVRRQKLAAAKRAAKG
jgi:hypothetical protein